MSRQTRLNLLVLLAVVALSPLSPEAQSPVQSCDADAEAGVVQRGLRGSIARAGCRSTARR